MNPIYKKSLFFMLLANFPLFAYALGSAQGSVNTTISSIGGNGQGVFTVRVNGTYITPPACANAAANQFSVSAETRAGKAIIATILTAQASGKNLGIQGAGTCNIGGQGSEDIYYVYAF